MDEDYKNNSVYKEYSDYLKNKLSDSNKVKLTRIKHINEFSGEVKMILYSMYDSGDEIMERIGSIFNAIYTQQNNVFLIVKSSVSDLVKKDVNNSHKSCNTETYKDIMNRLFSNGIIKELRKAVQRTEGVASRAGLYELVDYKLLKPLVDSIGKDVCNSKKDLYIKWYDGEYKYKLEDDQKLENIIVPTKVKTPFELEIERRVNEKLGKK